MTQPTPPSDGPKAGLPFLGRYLLVVGSVVGAIVAAGWALAAVGVALPPGAAAILPPVVGALHVGQHWGRTRGAVPSGAAAWRWALVAGLAYLALLTVLALPFLTATVLPVAAMLIGGTALMAILLNRFFLGLGARSGVARGAGR